MSGFLTARETIPPERLLFARGCRGGIVRSIQQRLQTARAYGGVNDGIYGARTESGVSEFQRRNGLAVTGNVDGRTWSVLMERSIPSVFERALLLTAAFEGHGYGTVRGNWDGAWLTWGIVGFTLKHGEIGRILLTAAKLDPNLLASAFGNASAGLIKILQASRAEQKQWADSITDGVNVKEPWRSGFERLGGNSTVQALQCECARSAYYIPAVRTAAAFALGTERGLALAFDIHVQNGGVGGTALAAIVAHRADDEPARRVIIANAVADAALPEFRDDVRARKLAIATGEGTVHDQEIITAHWGLAEYSVLGGAKARMKAISSSFN